MNQSTQNDYSYLLCIPLTFCTAVWKKCVGQQRLESCVSGCRLWKQPADGVRNSPGCVSETSKKEERTDLGQRVSDKSVKWTPTKNCTHRTSLLAPQSHNNATWATTPLSLWGQCQHHLPPPRTELHTGCSRSVCKLHWGQTNRCAALWVCYVHRALCNTGALPDRFK